VNARQGFVPDQGADDDARTEGKSTVPAMPWGMKERQYENAETNFAEKLFGA